MIIRNCRSFLVSIPGFERSDLVSLEKKRFQKEIVEKHKFTFTNQEHAMKNENISFMLSFRIPIKTERSTNSFLFSELRHDNE